LVDVMWEPPTPAGPGRTAKMAGQNTPLNLSQIYNIARDCHNDIKKNLKNFYFYY